jgi:hypothetical protein
MASIDLLLTESSDNSGSDTENRAVKRGRGRGAAYNWVKLRSYPEKETAVTEIELQKL